MVDVWEEIEIFCGILSLLTVDSIPASWQLMEQMYC